MAEDVVEVVAARIEAVVGAARVVYRYGPPAGDLPARYLLVTGSAGETASTGVTGLADERRPSVDVMSVARDADASVAAREALWGSRRVVDALTDWRPTLGRATWLPEHLSSGAPRPDDSLPDLVMVATERWSLTYQP